MNTEQDSRLPRMTRALRAEEFYRLPFLLKLSEVMELSGLGKRQLHALVLAGTLRVVRTSTKRAWWRFVRDDLGRLFGIEPPQSAIKRTPAGQSACGLAGVHHQGHGP